MRSNIKFFIEADGDFLIHDPDRCGSRRNLGGERLLVVFATENPGEPKMTPTNVALSYLQQCVPTNLSAAPWRWQQAIREALA